MKKILSPTFLIKAADERLSFSHMIVDVGKFSLLGHPLEMAWIDTAREISHPTGEYKKCYEREWMDYSLNLTETHLFCNKDPVIQVLSL